MPFTVKIDPNVTTPQAQVIPDATQFNDGVMSKAQVAQLAGATSALSGVVAPADMVIFLASSGSDSNAGSSPSTPVQTYERALQLAAGFNRGGALIQIQEPGVYPIGVPSIATGFPLGPTGTPLATVGAPATLQVLYTPVEVAGDPTGLTITVGAPTFVGDLSLNAFIRCVSGAAAGIERMIVSNDATSIKVNTPFSFEFGPAIPISPGDIFEVTQRTAVIEYTLPFLAPASTIGFKDIKLLGATGFNFMPTTAFLVFQGVELDMNGGAVIQGYALGAVKAGDEGGNFLFWGKGGAPFNNMNGSGVILKNGFFAFGGTSGDGFFVMRNAVIEVSQGFFQLLDVDMRSGSQLSCIGGIMQLTQNFSLAGSHQGLIDATGLASSPVQYSNGTGSVGQVKIQNAVGVPAVSLDNGSHVDFTDAVGGVVDGNTDVGIDAKGASTARTDPSTLLSGTVGDTRISGTVTAYGGLPFTSNGSTIVPAGT